jgi:two-component system, OmpR family, response regulator
MDSCLVVLVVEDEALVRSQIASEFRRAGWDVLEAGTGERAIALLDEHGDQIDVIFTDINLGGCVTGWDVADAFRATYPRKRIVYASGNSVDPRRVLSDTQFLRKPYRGPAVLEACAFSRSYAAEGGT